MWGAIQKHSTSFGLLNPQNKAIGRYYFVHFTDSTEAQKGKVHSKDCLGFELKWSMSRPLNPQAVVQKSNVYAYSARFVFQGEKSNAFGGVQELENWCPRAPQTHPGSTLTHVR